MDQVPLPFVVNQDYTYTIEDDKDVHISAPSESSSKRQYTMHVVVNAGDADKREGYVDIVAKGKGKRITNAEKMQWDDRVDVFWQENAWVDAVVMRDLATKFVQFKNKTHGESTWVLLFCDNLSAHLDEEVKEIFGNGKVFLYYFPPSMTEVVQPIDAGYGRSLRCIIGNLLDNWLMDTGNLAKWEQRMTAAQRRVLVIHFVANTNAMMLSEEKDSLRIGCFERTGCLITHAVDDEKDSKIRPQGVTVPFTVPTIQPAPQPAQENSINDNVDGESAIEGDGSNHEDEGFNNLQQYLDDDDNTNTAELLMEHEGDDAVTLMDGEGDDDDN